MAKLKKPKKIVIPPIPRRPIGRAKVTKDLKAKLEARLAARVKKNEKKK